MAQLLLLYIMEVTHSGPIGGFCATAEGYPIIAIIVGPSAAHRTLISLGGNLHSTSTANTMLNATFGYIS